MREKEFLKQRYRAILSYTGGILILSGILMLSPLLVLLIQPHEAKDAWAFVIPAASLISLGFSSWWFFRPPSSLIITTHEGGVIVVISWTVVILFSSWPFIAQLDLEFTRALFESVSGWTTTGLSVVEVTKASRMILLWRSTMQLAGGAGLAIIMMSAIIGPAGVGLATAEGRNEQLVPHVQQSARLVLMIYAVYIGSGVLAYWLAGMNLFDAINHAFAAVSTGGFSTRAESIGYWDSVYIEAVTLPLMLLGNLSFVTAWFLWRGKFRSVICNGEVRLMTVLIPIAAAVSFIFTSRELYPRLGKSLRVALFETVSALTTTGFQTVVYDDWNQLGVLILIVFMLIGGGSCSTAGGIKQLRIYLLWKMINWEFRRTLLPSKAVMERSLWEGDRQVFLDDTRLRQLSVFVFLYLIAFMAGTAILSASGFSIHNSLFEFASALGTVGLSVGVTSATMPDAALWAEMLAMYLGRLEFIVLIVSIFKIGRDISHLLSSRRN